MMYVSIPFVLYEYHIFLYVELLRHVLLWRTKTMAVRGATTFLPHYVLPQRMLEHFAINYCASVYDKLSTCWVPRRTIQWLSCEYNKIGLCSFDTYLGKVGITTVIFFDRLLLHNPPVICSHWKYEHGSNTQPK